MNDHTNVTIVANFSQKKKNLILHKRIHTKERPYQCTQCDCAFSKTYILKRHMLKHLGEKSHICSLCDEAFTHECNLKHHKKVKHGEIINGRKYSTIQCIYKNCKEAFYQRLQLIEHMEQEHEEIFNWKYIEFASEDRFKTWKEEEESVSYTYFSKQTSTKNNSYFYYNCQRDGHS